MSFDGIIISRTTLRILGLLLALGAAGLLASIAPSLVRYAKMTGM